MNFVKLDRNKIYSIGKHGEVILKVYYPDKKCTTKYEIYRAKRRKNKIILYTANEILKLTFDTIERAKENLKLIKVNLI